MPATVFFIRKVLGCVGSLFRYDLTSDEGWSSSPWIELGDWTRFLYNNYNFYERQQHTLGTFLCKGIFRCNQVLAHVPSIEMDETTKTRYWHKLLSCVHCGIFR